MAVAVADRHGAGPAILGTALLGERRSTRGAFGGRQHVCGGPAHHFPGRVPDKLLGGVRPPHHGPLRIEHRYRRIGYLSGTHRLGEWRVVGGVRHPVLPIGAGVRQRRRVGRRPDLWPWWRPARRLPTLDDFVHF